jgi:hypothetical protein
MLIRIPVKGKAELQFWVRAFQLEEEIHNVVGILLAGKERVKAFVPIISEYEMGTTLWVYILAMRIDSLGLLDGEGAIWMTSGEEHRKLALKDRNELADYAIDLAKKAGKFDELIEMDPKKDV